MIATPVSCESSKPLIIGSLLSLSCIFLLIRHRLDLATHTWRRCLLGTAGAGLVGAFVVYLRDLDLDTPKNRVETNSNPLTPKLQLASLL